MNILFQLRKLKDSFHYENTGQYITIRFASWKIQYDGLWWCGVRNQEQRLEATKRLIDIWEKKYEQHAPRERSTH